MYRGSIFICLLWVMFYTSCSHKMNLPIEELKPEIDKILESLSLQGSVLIYDENRNKYYYNDFSWARRGFLPASTFKIVNTIISLETGVMPSDTTIIRWDGKKRWLKAWEEDLTLKKAFQVSCVPCYQEIARSIGLQRMKYYLEKLSYPGTVIDSVTLDNFWLEGKSKISQYEQIAFLKKVYHKKLPVSKRTSQLILDIMKINYDSPGNLSGKTGLSTQYGRNGWFVGFYEIKGNVYYFATNVIPGVDMPENDFPAARIEATKSILKLFYNTE